MLKLRELKERKKQELLSKDYSVNANSVNRLPPARLRLQNDLDNLDLPPKCTLNTETAISNINEQPLIVVHICPQEGPYSGGNFKFSLQFSDMYPIEPPSIICVDRIFHPNIDPNGKICLNILREDWSPALDLTSIVIGLLYLFLDFTATDPLNKQAAEILANNRDLFNELVQQAMWGNEVLGNRYDRVVEK